MGLHGFPEYDDGAPPSLSDFRRLGALAHNLRTPDAGDGAMDAGESGFAYTPPPDISLWARLTAAGTGTYLGKYSWKQVQDDGTGAAVDAPGGMVGAFDGSTGPPAVERNGATGLTVGATTGSVVRMWLAESGEHYWFRDQAAAGALAVWNDTSPTVSVSPASTLVLASRQRGGFVLDNPGVGTARWKPPQGDVLALFRRDATQQSVANATLTAVTFDTALYNTAGSGTSWGTVPTSTITPPGVVGWPNPSNMVTLVQAQVAFDALSGGTRYAEIYASSGEVLAAAALPASPGDFPTVLNLSAETRLAFGSGAVSLSLNVWQNSGAALNVGLVDASGYFGGFSRMLRTLLSATVYPSVPST